MNIRTELSNMKAKDYYSVMLFCLYKMTNLPEYSTLSELAFILDKDSLLKLCEYFGGITIKIPTISELEVLVNTLILYKTIEVDKLPFNDAVKQLSERCECMNDVLNNYNQLAKLLSEYSIEGA